MITLTGTQEKAVLNILIWFGETEKQEFYLAGYAGTGKTTITEEAINRLKERYKIKNILTGAYTGKAAHVMHKKGAENAQTIHSMIYQPVEDP
ncbi:AAA family ATPase, partial [uncultured Kiloniella sp.]|uniref:AAA family ATPase n=1 Tax=uncultured Kiloniella sp. TaxID=1133091 RepID=UPI0026161F5A